VTKKVTAEEFNKQPGAVYRAADRGQKVVINHDHFKDKVFTLTATDREEERKKSIGEE